MNSCAFGDGPLRSSVFPPMPSRTATDEEKCTNLRFSQNEPPSAQDIYSEGLCALSGGPVEGSRLRLSPTPAVVLE